MMLLKQAQANQPKSEVKRLQKRLAELGFDPNGIDGIFGEGTRAAVCAFQAANGLDVDGVVGPATRAALGLGANGSNGAKSKGTRKMTAKGVAFLARHEGFSGSLYNDPAGHCTIGFGHLVHLGACNGSEPQKFKDGLTKEQALQLMAVDVQSFADAVADGVTVELAPHQFDALVSFAYNVGTGAFLSSTLRKKLNAGDYAAVPSELAKWVKAGSATLPGLVKRRKEEGILFSTGQY